MFLRRLTLFWGEKKIRRKRSETQENILKLYNLRSLLSNIYNGHKNKQTQMCITVYTTETEAAKRMFCDL